MYVAFIKLLIQKCLSYISIFIFINVNQGDCCILRPTGCHCNNEIFYIDLGDGISCYITKYINAVNPQFAIISHKNGKFGKSKGTYPNSEVIE